MTHFGTISMESKFSIRPERDHYGQARVVEQHGRTFRGEATVTGEDGKAVLEFASVFKVARDDRIRA